MLSSRIVHRKEGIKKIVKILKFHLNISTICQFLWRNKVLINIPNQVQEHQQKVKKYPVLLIWHQAYKQDQFNDGVGSKEHHYHRSLDFSCLQQYSGCLPPRQCPRGANDVRKDSQETYLSFLAKFFSTVGLYKIDRGSFIAYN